MTKLGCEETVGEGVGALAPGTEVEVIRGPLTGVRGVLIRREPRCRLVISVNVIRQGAEVEIDAVDVEPI